jgi:hypothetical protein
MVGEQPEGGPPLLSFYRHNIEMPGPAQDIDNHRCSVPDHLQIDRTRADF